MKKLALTLIVSISLFTPKGIVYCQSEVNAGQYMDEVFGPTSEIKDNTWQYLKAVTRGKGARKVENKRQSLIAETKAMKYEVKKVGGYKGDYSLVDAVAGYLDLSYIVMKEDFGKILDMEAIAEQSYDLMEAYLLAKEKANEKLHAAHDTLVKAQNDFAERYDVTIIKGESDKTTEKINKASETLSYYNDIYLIFFKCYKQEAYALDAMERNDVNALEQNSNALLAYCEESLSNLKSTKAHNGDASIKVAAQRIIMFYKTEAEEDFPAMSNFYIKKDDFEKIKRSFESISKKDLTQSDVDQYNKAGQEYNKAIAKANNIAQKSYSERTRNLDFWNKSVEKFFNTHSK